LISLSLSPLMNLQLLSAETLSMTTKCILLLLPFILGSSHFASLHLKIFLTPPNYLSCFLSPSITLESLLFLLRSFQFSLVYLKCY
jgi:hypothetical protein